MEGPAIPTRLAKLMPQRRKSTDSDTPAMTPDTSRQDRDMEEGAAPAPEALSSDGHASDEDHESMAEQQNPNGDLKHTQSQQNLSESDSDKCLFAPTAASNPTGGADMERARAPQTPQPDFFAIDVSDHANGTDDLHTTRGQCATSTATPSGDSEPHTDRSPGGASQNAVRR